MDIQKIILDYPAAQAIQTRTSYLSKTTNALANLPKQYCVDGTIGCSKGYPPGELIIHPRTGRVMSDYTSPFCMTKFGIKKCMFANASSDNIGTIAHITDSFTKKNVVKKTILKYNAHINFPQIATELQYWDIAYNWANKDNRVSNQGKCLLLQAIAIKKPSKDAIAKYREIHMYYFWSKLQDMIGEYKLTRPFDPMTFEPTFEWFETKLDTIVKQNVWDWLSICFREREISRQMRLFVYKEIVKSRY